MPQHPSEKELYLCCGSPTFSLRKNIFPVRKNNFALPKNIFAVRNWCNFRIKTAALQNKKCNAAINFMRMHRYPTGSQQLALDKSKVVRQLFFELHARSKENAHIGNVFGRHIIFSFLTH